MCRSGPVLHIEHEVYLRYGQTNPDSSQRHQSRLVILIFGWMGARFAHLQKYTKIYEELYPTATQILIRSSPSFFWSSEATANARLAPVAQILGSLGCCLYSGPKISLPNRVKLPKFDQPRILVHAFSNGGSSQMVYLGRMLSSHIPKSIPDIPRLKTAIILDSCPGIGHLDNSRRAFTVGIRNPIIRSLVYLVLTIALPTMFAWRRILGKKPFFELLREALNSVDLLPWTHSYTPRLYLFSKKDDMILAEDVLSHADEAKRLGFRVSTEIFTESGHVAHARESPERYWGAVQRVWEEAHILQ
ncbi:hypothetical protein BD779DRAFT_1572350 [Infundibulicybe gibba]|nr:hypothetical protein BD779DRAFT_1572350 [Infundibulicybe gibba]